MDGLGMPNHCYINTSLEPGELKGNQGGKGAKSLHLLMFKAI